MLVPLPPPTSKLHPHFIPSSGRHVSHIGPCLAPRVLVLDYLLRNRNAEYKKYITCHIDIFPLGLVAALQRKRMIQSIVRSMYTGRRIAVTTPWATHSSKDTLRSTMADTIALSAGYATDRLDRLPVELVIEILLQLDIPSLTRFRSLSHRAMQLVNSVRQYTAIIKHCPNIIHAIVSIQGDAFDCRTLYRTLCTTRCSTCNRFGNLIDDCHRVCFFCFSERPEYFLLTRHEAHKLFTSNAKPHSNLPSFHKLFKLANPPSLPGRYNVMERNLRQRRL